MLIEMETRILGERLEVREEAGRPTLVGYAAVFNSRSLDLGGFIEIVRPGAFKRSLSSGADVLALVNHNDDRILGRNKSGSLKLTEDERGLKVEITPPDTQVARDAIADVKAGNYDAMSFAFRAVTEKWDSKSEPPLRELYDVDIRDVSIVARPAYPKTEIALRSLKAAIEATTPEVVGLAEARERGLRLREKILTSGHHKP